jgi:hypothetical protein
MYKPTPKLSCYLSSHFRPHVDKNKFQLFYEKEDVIQYKSQWCKPVVIHFPGGKKNEYWRNYFIDKMDQQNLKKLQNTKNLHIVQINNHNSQNKYSNPGEYFLRKSELSFTILGKNIDRYHWKNSIKIILLYEYLNQIPITKEQQYFLFFDSSDAILIRPPEQLIHALDEYKCKILFGMDIAMYNGYLWPRNVIKTPTYMQEYMKKQYRFLNSGLIFGQVDEMKNVLSFLINENAINNYMPHKSDQHYYHKARFKFIDDIEVDYKKKYLLNIFTYGSFFEKHQDE